MPTKSELEDAIERSEELLTDLRDELDDMLYDVRAAHEQTHDRDGRTPWTVCYDPVCRRLADVEALADRVDEALSA